MARSASGRLAAALLAPALLAALLPPPAAAHCVPGTESHLLEQPELPSTCPLNEHLEAAASVLGEASDHALAVVFVKDFTFHPNVVAVRSGGTVLFVYADVDSNQIHDPRSSGGCANGASAAADPEGCVPLAPARCFDAVQDQGNFLRAPGDTYPLTLRYDAASGALQKSRGILSGTPVVGEPPFAQAFRACPAGTGANGPAQTVVAYHCGLHGAADTELRTMRGAVVVLA